MPTQPPPAMRRRVRGVDQVALGHFQISQTEQRLPPPVRVAAELDAEAREAVAAGQAAAEETPRSRFPASRLLSVRSPKNLVTLRPAPLRCSDE